MDAALGTPRSVPGLTIRAATSADLPRILALYREDELRTELPPAADTLLETFSAIERDPSHELVVAELAGEVVGTLQLTVVPYLHADGGCYIAQVEAVHVATARRGGGIGEHMMGWAIERARQRRCVRVQLTSQKARRDAHRFYARLGFTASHEGMKLYLP
jgi:GNAT superfamily N-acetyltransferase